MLHRQVIFSKIHFQILSINFGILFHLLVGEVQNYITRLIILKVNYNT